MQSHNGENPFLVGPMIKDMRYFVGRREELHRLTTAMDKTQATSVNVIGERRIGKSSLLYHFFQTWSQRVRQPERFVVVYLSLQEARCKNEIDLYQAIASELLQRSQVRNQSALAEPFQVKPLNRTNFVSAIDRWCELGVLPVICLDEFEVLIKAKKDFNDQFYDHLRSIVNASKLMLIIASKRLVVHYIHDNGITSTFFNDAQTITLSRFSDEEARDIVRLPASTIPGSMAVLSTDEQRIALAWAKHHPCLLQLAGSCLYEARQLGKDESWAEQLFQQESQSILYYQSGFRSLSCKGFFRWIFWKMPIKIGHIAKLVGARMDEMTAWVIGMALLTAFILLLLGYIPFDSLWKLILSQFNISP